MAGPTATTSISSTPLALIEEAARRAIAEAELDA